MANTHYYHVLSDAHAKGKPLGMLQPDVRTPTIGKSAGIRLTFVGAVPGSVVENTICRGVTSLTIARVTRKLDDTTLELERIGSGQFSPLLLQSPDTAFAQGETINFDSGGSAVASQIFDAQLTGPAFSQLHLSAELNSFTPDDAASGSPSDSVFWDPWAKPASTARVLASTITGPGGAGPATADSFVKGDRITTSGGGSFTLLAMPASGGDFLFAIGRPSGSIAPGQTLTNTRNGALATITAGAGNVTADVPAGQLVPHHILPNVGGLGTLYEVIPRGDGGGGIGVFQPIVRGAFALHQSAVDVNDRGTRVCPFASPDIAGIGDGFLYGGITVQTIKCTDVSFPSTWTIGETVTRGGWSGVLHDFDVANKMLFVYGTNGATLTAGTVTGSTSLTTATADGAAYGWMPGSRFWNAWVAQNTTIATRSNALWNGQAAKHEGLVLMSWEGELGAFARGCAFPGNAFIAARFREFIAAVRTQLGNPDLTVALMAFDPRSQMLVVPALAAFLSLAIVDVANTTPNCHVFTAEGMLGESLLPLPEPTAILYLAPDEYHKLGKRAWQALRYGQLEVVSGGNFEPIEIAIGVGHSFMQGGILPDLGFGLLDPDIAPSLNFPSVDTRKLPILNFHWGHNAWEVYDVAFSANSFLGIGTGQYGFEAPFLHRFAPRFAQDEEMWADIGWMKAHYGGSSINGAVKQATAAWDPAGTVRDPKVATCTVTAFAATSMAPQRGRFTATAGTFTGTAWVVGTFVQVAGSGLGQLGGGGNNSPAWFNHNVHAIAADGSWIELAGAFVNEGSRPFTLTAGPYALWPELVKFVKNAIAKCGTQLIRTWNLRAKVIWCAELDTHRPEEFEAALNRFLDAFDILVDQASKGEQKPPTIIMRLTSNTPWPVSDGAVLQVQQVQDAVAAARTAAGKPTKCINTDHLAMEYKAGVWPRVTRLDNGVHHTKKAFLDAGPLVDAGLATMPLIPPHPDGELAAVALDGAGDSAGGTEGAESDQTLDKSAAIGGADVIPPPTVEQTDELTSAMYESPDIKRYRTQAGLEVERFDAEDTIKRAEYARQVAARRAGLRQTLVRFD